MVPCTRIKWAFPGCINFQPIWPGNNALEALQKKSLWSRSALAMVFVITIELVISTIQITGFQIWMRERTFRCLDHLLTIANTLSTLGFIKRHNQAQKDRPLLGTRDISVFRSSIARCSQMAVPWGPVLGLAGHQRKRSSATVT